MDQCKKELSFGYRLYAGLAHWKETPDTDDDLVECGKLCGGTVVLGRVVELGMPEEAAPKQATATIKLADGTVMTGQLVEEVEE